jgi:hypothetical protein
MPLQLIVRRRIGQHARRLCLQRSDCNGGPGLRGMHDGQPPQHPPTGPASARANARLRTCAAHPLNPTSVKVV